MLPSLRWSWYWTIFPSDFELQDHLHSLYETLYEKLPLEAERVMVTTFSDMQIHRYFVTDFEKVRDWLRKRNCYRKNFVRVFPNLYQIPDPSLKRKR